MDPELKPKPRSYRWVVLVCYMLAGMVSQLLWITYSPVLAQASSAFSVSQSDIGLLSAVYPLVYVVASIPAGYFVDSAGFRKAILVGTSLLALSGILRCFSPNFSVLLVLQGVGALGQPFILNSVSKVVKGWFPETEVALATGMGTLSLFIGIVLGLGLTPALVDGFGLSEGLLVYGVFSLAVLLAFFALGKESERRDESATNVRFSQVLSVLRNRNILLLSALFFVGLGIFNSFATWVDPLFSAKGIGTDLSGLLGGVMIIGGVIGSVVIPGLSDRFQTLKKPMLISLALSAVLWYVLGAVGGVVPISVTLLVLGFFFMSTLPLALELSARSLEERLAGMANSVVWEFSQVGGFVLIILYQVIAGSSGWGFLFYFSALLTLIMLGFSFLLKSK